MAKLKFDVTDVESGGGGGPQPTPGMYRMKILEINEKESKSSGNPMLEVKLEVQTDSKGKKTEFRGSSVYTYIVLNEQSAWKYRELLEAVGSVKGKKTKGVFDTDKAVGTVVQVQIKPDSYNDEYKARVGKLLPVGESEEDDEDLDDDEGDDEEQDYSEMSIQELKAEAEERELDIPKKKGGALKAALIALLEEDDEESDEDPEDDEDDSEDEDSDDETEDYDEDDLKELALSELKEIAEDKGAEVEGKVTKAKLVKAILEAQEGDDEDEDEPEDSDEEEGDEEDYSTWELDDLKAELKERELKTTGSKKILVARLEKDDESSEDPF